MFLTCMDNNKTENKYEFWQYKFSLLTLFMQLHYNYMNKKHNLDS